MTGFLDTNEKWDSYSLEQRAEILTNIEINPEVYSNQLWSELPLVIKEEIGKKSQIRFWGLK